MTNLTSGLTVLSSTDEVTLPAGEYALVSAVEIPEERWEMHADALVEPCDSFDTPYLHASFYAWGTAPMLVTQPRDENVAFFVMPLRVARNLLGDHAPVTRLTLAADDRVSPISVTFDAALFVAPFYAARDARITVNGVTYPVTFASAATLRA